MADVLLQPCTMTNASDSVEEHFKRCKHANPITPIWQCLNINHVVTTCFLAMGLSHEVSAWTRAIALCRRGWVFALKRDFPNLRFSLNGMVDSCNEAAALLGHGHDIEGLEGIMIGRAAYHCTLS